MGIIWFVEGGDREEKRFLDCTATILSLPVLRGEEEGASRTKQMAFLGSRIDFH